MISRPNDMILCEVATTFNYYGYECISYLHPPFDEIKKYISKLYNNDVCLFVVEAIAIAVINVKKSGIDPNKIIYLITDPRVGCMYDDLCRMLRVAFDMDGLSGVEIIPFCHNPGLSNLPIGMTIRFDIAFLLFNDLVEQCTFRTRPYEIIKGDTERLRAEIINEFTVNLISLSIFTIKNTMTSIIDRFRSIPTRKRDRRHVYILSFCSRFVGFRDYIDAIENLGMEVHISNIYPLINDSSTMMYLINKIISVVKYIYSSYDYLTPPLNFDYEETDKYFNVEDLHGESYTVASQLVTLLKNGASDIIFINPLFCPTLTSVAKSSYSVLKKNYPNYNMLALEVDQNGIDMSHINRIKMFIEMPFTKTIGSGILPTKYIDIEDIKSCSDVCSSCTMSESCSSFGTNVSIYYGTTSGTSKSYARSLMNILRNIGIRAVIRSMNRFSSKNGIVIFITSTTGDGDYSIDSKRMYMCNDNLSKCNVYILGLGDSSYPKFNKSAIDLNKVLCSLNANVIKMILSDSKNGHDTSFNELLYDFGKYMHVELENNFSFMPEGYIDYDCCCKFILPGMIEVTLNIPNMYTPGDYIAILAPDKNGRLDMDERGRNRPRIYSISSGVCGKVTLLVKVCENGKCSRYLSSLVGLEGCKIKCLLLQSNFHLPNSSTDIVLLCTGSGIAPFLSFVRSGWNLGKISMIYGCKNFGDVPYIDELKNIDLKIAYSQENVDDKYVQDIIDKNLSRQSIYYVCGSATKSIVEYILSIDKNIIVRTDGW